MLRLLILAVLRNAYAITWTTGAQKACGFGQTVLRKSARIVILCKRFFSKPFVQRRVPNGMPVVQVMAYAFLTCCMLSGCYYHPYQEQGTILSEVKVSKIRPGMNAAQVRNILGDPVLSNIYYNGLMIYVYSTEPPHKKMRSEKIVIYFRYDRVTRVESNVGEIALPKPPSAYYYE